MLKVDSDFITFKSIFAGLDRHLFPSRIKDEVNDVEIVASLLDNPDVEKFLNPEFIKQLRAKLNGKAEGLVKQAELNQSALAKFTKQG